MDFTLIGEGVNIIQFCSCVSELCYDCWFLLTNTEMRI